jgi:hypothetical protein
MQDGFDNIPNSIGACQRLPCPLAIASSTSVGLGHGIAGGPTNLRSVDVDQYRDRRSGDQVLNGLASPEFKCVQNRCQRDSFVTTASVSYHGGGTRTAFTVIYGVTTDRSTMVLCTSPAVGTSSPPFCKIRTRLEMPGAEPFAKDSSEHISRHGSGIPCHTVTQHLTMRTRLSITPFDEH